MKYYFTLPHTYSYDWSISPDVNIILSTQSGTTVKFVRNNFVGADGNHNDLYLTELNDAEEDEVIFYLKTGFKRVVA